MRPLIPAILLASTSLAVAFNGSEASVRAKHAQHARNFQARSSKQYKLVDHYGPQEFMDESHWQYFTDPDPTGGQTKYLSHADAAKAGLAYVENNQAILAVDSKHDLPLGANRDSIRIMSTKAYNRGLFIADFQAMPHGCAVWPAYWSTGTTWPRCGEIDIIEGVNLNTRNQYTLHTGPGSHCQLSRSTGGEFTGTVQSTNCASSTDSNAGCEIVDSQANSFGHPLNVDGGAVFAHLWTKEELAIWRFERNSIPKDIWDKQPNPSSWPKPEALFSSLGCDLSSQLYDQHLILNIALGGGWANSDYKPAGCPSTIGHEISKGKNFIYAKWEINYIDVYQ